MGRARADISGGAPTAVPDIDVVAAPRVGRPDGGTAAGSVVVAALGSVGRSGGVSAREPATPPAPDPSCNEVRLVGRLGVGLRELTLPSGDPVVSFHLVVSRPPRGRRDQERRPREPTVDTLACAAWTSRCRRTVLAATAGDVLEVEGALRRRFRRAAGGSPVSFYEVEVSRVRRRSMKG